MSRFVVATQELDHLGRGYDSLAAELETSARRVRRDAAKVTFNEADPAFSIESFRSRSWQVSHDLSRLAAELAADADVMRRSARGAEEADGVLFESPGRLTASAFDASPVSNGGSSVGADQLGEALEGIGRLARGVEVFAGLTAIPAVGSALGLLAHVASDAAPEAPLDTMPADRLVAVAGVAWERGWQTAAEAMRALTGDLAQIGSETIPTSVTTATGTRLAVPVNADSSLGLFGALLALPPLVAAGLFVRTDDVDDLNVEPD